MADIEIVVAVIVVEVSQISGIVAHRDGFIGSSTVSIAAPQGVLCIPGQPPVRATDYSNLQRSVTVVASAGFVIDFRKGTKNICPTVVDVELTNDDAVLSRIGVGTDGNDPVCDASKEEVSSKAADKSAGHHKPARQI